MTIKKVVIERQVEQVKDGTHYKGCLKFADVQLDFELVFGVHIKELDNTEVIIKDLDDMMKVFQISVTRDGVKIELSDDEYGLFFSLLVEHTIDFYNHPQTRDTNEGIFGKVLRGEGLFTQSAGSIIMTGHVTADFDETVQEMMSDPKFGCVFTE